MARLSGGAGELGVFALEGGGEVKNNFEDMYKKISWLSFEVLLSEEKDLSHQLIQL